MDNDNLLNCYVNAAKKWSSPHHVLRLLHADFFFALRQKFFQVKNTRGAKLDFEKLQDGIKLEVQKAILDYKAKQEILKEKILASELASSVLNQAKLQYKNRLISMTTLLSQETNYRQSQTMLLNAKYENSLALARLNLVLGQNLQKDYK